MPSYGDGTRYGSGARYGAATNPRIKMSKFKRDLKKDPIPNKTTRGTEIITACNGNAALGDLTAELAAFTTRNTALKTTATTLATTQAAVTSLVDQQGVDETGWDGDFEALLVKIESNTHGDKIKMATTTVPTYDPGATPPTPPGGIPQPANLSVTQGDMPHSLDLAWNGVQPRPRLYLVRMCEGTYNQANMVQIGMPSASHFTVPNLLAGHTYWFEVAAAGSGNQQGPWSDPATGMAL